MYFSGKMEDKASVNKSSVFPIGLLLAVCIDIAIDGLLLGIGFAAGRKEGILLSLALATENLTLSLATASSLGRQGIRANKVLSIIIILAAIFFLFSMAGDALFHNLEDTSMEIILSFGLAALLFLVTEELLVKAHAQKDNIWLTAPFFIGYLLFLILGVTM
jgi:ZIP family zinc transporter